MYEYIYIYIYIYTGKYLGRLTINYWHKEELHVIYCHIVLLNRGTTSSKPLRVFHPLNTAHKLNVHKAYKKVLDFFCISYVCSIFVLCPESRS